MTVAQLKNDLKNLIHYATFEYKGKRCGVDPVSKKHFDMWYGENDYAAKSIDEVMSHPLFDGKTLPEIFDDIIDLEVF